MSAQPLLASSKINPANLEKFCGRNSAHYLKLFQEMAHHQAGWRRFNIFAFLGGPYWAAARGLWSWFWIGYCIDILAFGAVFALDRTFVTQSLGFVAFCLGRLFLGMSGDFAYWHAFCLWKTSQASRYRFDARRLTLVSALMVPSGFLAVLGLIGVPLAPWLTVFPAHAGLTFEVQGAINQTINWFSVQWGSLFDSTTAAMRWMLDSIESRMQHIPWPAIAIPLCLLAWRRGGIRMLVLCSSILLYLGLFGYWSKSISTMSLVMASVFICIIFGVPLGIICAKYKFIQKIADPLMDIMQTMPSFVYLLPAIAFFSIGKPPAILATVIFAMPPVIKLTTLGIQQIPINAKEAMLAFGASPLQLLIKAELPMALPSIMTGINQSIMMSLSMVVIAALIGAEGLGYDVLTALQQMDNGSGILAGIAIVVCAMLLDRLIRYAKPHPGQ